MYLCETQTKQILENLQKGTTAPEILDQLWMREKAPSTDIDEAINRHSLHGVLAHSKGQWANNRLADEAHTIDHNSDLRHVLI